MNKAQGEFIPRALRVCFQILLAIMGVLFMGLFLHGLIRTSVFHPEFRLYERENVLYLRDNLWNSLLWIFGVFGVGFLLIRLLRSVPPFHAAVGMLCVVFSLACFWTLTVHPEPCGDSARLYETAGNLALLSDDYFKIYPHQLGFLSYMEGMRAVFGEGALNAMRIVNALWLVATYAALLSLVWLYSESNRIRIVSVVLLGMAAQPVLFCSFCYGNLPSLGASMISLALCAYWLRSGGAWRIAAAVLIMMAAVLLKLNALIIALAAAIMLMLWGLSRRRISALLLAALLLICPISAQNAHRQWIERVHQQSFGEGTPLLAWLAMGLQDGGKACGWYNGYVYELLDSYDFDAKLAQEVAADNLRERVSEFASNPLSAANFFYHKTISQWNETTFQSIWLNRVGIELVERPAWVRSMVCGPFADGLSRYMDGYTLLLYLGMALFCFRLARRLTCAVQWQALLGLLTLCVCTFGGFLYHTLFEAKSQYIMSYIIIIIPLAACGWAWFVSELPKRQVSKGDHT